jgi:uncharacterized protein (TIGR00369 family)
MAVFTAPDPQYATRVLASFERQGIMRLIGARMTRVEPGHVEIELPYRSDLTQQHGFFHAGVTGTIADSAGGYAGYTLFPADSSVLTVEYKMNYVSPAEGEKLLAIGRVKKTGRSLTVCELEVLAVKSGTAKSCAFGLQTLMCLPGRADVPQSR